MTAPATEAPRRLRCRRWLLPTMAIALIALAGGVLVWTLQTRQGAAPVIPVAIVNSDKPVTTGSGKDAQTIAAGRQLAGALTQPASKDQTPLSWKLVDTDDAAAGLRDGGYYAVLTIPESFSADVTSTSGDHPKTAELKLVSNDASSTAVAAMAQLAVGQAAASLGNQVTTNFTDNVLQSFNSINSSLTSSAKSAHQLADSSHDLADSSDNLADGADSLAGGAAELAKGASKSADGARQVASGASKLDRAAGSLASGARKTAAGADRLDSSADRVASGNSRLADQTEVLAQRVARLHQASGRLATGSTRVATRARELSRSCPAAVDRAYCREVRRLALASSVEAGAARVLNRASGGVDRRAARVDDGADVVAGASRALARGTGVVASGADQVASGARSLDAAAGSLAAGAASASDGANQLVGGADQNASGAKKLDSGAAQLASGAKKLADGNDQLAEGLDRGAKSVPTYDKDERKQLSAVVTTPVAVDAKADHQATVAAGITPAVLALALWLGTLMMFLTRGAVPTGAIWEQASAGRRVLLGWLPAVLVGAAQAALLLLVVWLAGVKVHSPIGLALFCALAVVSFAATNQALVAVFGGVGRLVSLAFAVIEAAALGGVVPIQTAPGFLQLLNGVLPLPQFVDGAGQLLLGGSAGNLALAIVVLALWTVFSLIASVLATARIRPRLSTRPALPVATPAYVPSQ